VEITCGGAKKGFGHLRAAGVLDANEENVHALAGRLTAYELIGDAA